MVHHVSLAVLLPIYFLYQIGDFYIAAMFLQNASTPLLHGRYILLKSELKGSVLHKCCAACLLVVFFAVRILLWPLLFVVLARDANVSIFEVHKHVRSYCLLTSAAMGAMNMAWWASLVRKIMRIDMRIQRRLECSQRARESEENTSQDSLGQKKTE
jgi:hypothetical protein